MKIQNCKVVMIVGVIAVIISPILCTRGSYWRIFDFSETGQIVDMVSGITAPIVEIVSILYCV